MNDELKELLGNKADAFEKNQELVQSVIAVCGGKLSLILPAVLALSGGSKKAAAKKAPAKKKASSKKSK